MYLRIEGINLEYDQPLLHFRFTPWPPRSYILRTSYWPVNLSEYAAVGSKSERRIPSALSCV